MVNQYLGEIKLFGGNFAMRGFAACAGNLLSISQNTALFSLIGTFYGGNGTSNFALPDLRGRAVQQLGSSTEIGEPSGTEFVTLTTQEYPAHAHAMSANTVPANVGLPTNNFLGTVTPNANTTGKIYAAPGALQPLNPAALPPYVGGNQPHENRQPFLAMTYLIAMQGVFPTRN